VALQHQVAHPHARVGSDLRLDLSHVCLDHVKAQLPGHRDAMVAVADEVHVPDPVDVDRRHPLAAPDRLRDPLPPPLHAARGRAKAPIELAGAVDRADDRVERDRLEPEPPLALATERLDHLVEGQDQVYVARLSPEPAREA
jgi:hypothetical protein